MQLLNEIRERRLLPFMGAYMVSGFVGLEGVDQLVGNNLLPALAYRIALVVYLFGVPGSLTIAWFHGAKGRQGFVRTEIIIHVVLSVLAAATIGLVVRSHRTATRLAEAAASSGLNANSIAVLYFEDFGPGGELSFVADGLTEALIDQLAQVRSLDVVSRNAVLPYRGTDVTPDSVARALKVGSLIRGSVEPAGDELRITTRLVDGLSGADIERRVFEIPAGEFLAARDSVAENVARILRRRLGEEVELRERRAETANVEAWSLVQRASRLVEAAEDAADAGDIDRAMSSLAEADSILSLAEAADGTWVQPPALRAHAAFRGAYFLATGPGDLERAGSVIEGGLEHARRALSLDPRDPQALEQQGALEYLLYLLDLSPDPAESERLLADARTSLETAVQIDPTLASAHAMLSHLYYNQDDYVSVVLAARRAYEEDAYLRDADRILERLFWAHYDLEQLRDARMWCEEGGRRFPEGRAFAECRLWLMVSLPEPAPIDSAWALKARLDSVAPESERAFWEHLGNLLVAGALRKASLPDSAEAVFARGKGNEEIDPQQDLVSYEAAIRAITGDADGAVRLLGAYLAANPRVVFYTESGLHWWWRSLASRPDFQALINR